MRVNSSGNADVVPVKLVLDCDRGTGDQNTKILDSCFRLPAGRQAGMTEILPAIYWRCILSSS
ncbi:MAG: hypothetical protein A2042_00280 [Candidatus Schekmanbacteria bacterium GWA2_38_11]|uniref:Uncharacterized protein n=1 Tax=Candidatus Schekmanbacteria bacterium GWA2_38_11 TaxID=1817876 RepID=A0A1F7RGI7_9BACT|nr:MAG: hypothetical protein A2042_00280 [Candidatus Schekmanbacteria bacterium GWA2_38_11]